jgi:hypothetical protein
VQVGEIKLRKVFRIWVEGLMKAIACGNSSRRIRIRIVAWNLTGWLKPLEKSKDAEAPCGKRCADTRP